MPAPSKTAKRKSAAKNAAQRRKRTTNGFVVSQYDQRTGREKTYVARGKAS